MLGIDVLNPNLITVGGRIYRVQGSSASTLGHAPERGEHAVGRRGGWQEAEEDDDEPVEGLGAAPRSAGARGRGAVAAAGGSRAPADEAAGEEDMIDESLISQEGSNFVARLSCDAEVRRHLSSAPACVLPAATWYAEGVGGARVQAARQGASRPWSATQHDSP